MKRIDPQKLLQPTSSAKQANFSAKFLVPARNVENKTSAKVEESNTPQQQELKQKTSSIKLKFIEVTKLFSNKSKLEKNKNRAKRIEAERERRKRREEEKENSKTTFKFGSILPKLSLPRTGFLDTIKRFLLYSLLGFAVDAFAPLIPKLLELGKTIVPAIRFLTGFVGALAGKVVDYIDTGYRAFDTLKGYINSIIPPNVGATFERFSGALNLALNGALVAAMATVSVLPTLMGSGDIDVDPKTGRPKKKGAGRFRKGLGFLGLLGAGSLLNPKVRKFLAKQLDTRRQRTAFQQGRARAELGTRRRIKRELLKRAAAQTRKKENLADDVRELRAAQQRRTGFAPGLGGAIDLTPREKKRIRSIQITGRDGSVEKYRLDSRGKVIDYKETKFKDFRKITGDVDPAAQRRFVSPTRTETGQYKNFNISGVKTTRTGKQFVEVALPGTTRKRVSPRTGRALQYLMAQNNPIDDMTAREIFKNPQDFTEIVTDIERQRREMRAPSPTRRIDKRSVTQQRTPRGVREAARTGGLASKASGATRKFGKRLLGPVISTLFDIAVSVATGQDIDMALVSAAGAGLGSFVGAFLGSFLPGAGNVIGGVIGGVVGSVAAEYLYETLVKKQTDLKTDEMYDKMFDNMGRKNYPIMGDPDFKDPGLTPDTPGYKRYVDPQTPVIPQGSLPPLPPTNTRSGQNYGADRPDGRKHAGVDFDAGLNDTFYSRIGGKVMRILSDPNGYGNYVDIYNAELGVTERIAEGDVNLVKVGQVIKAGTPVQRGTSQTGVFHYEIRKGSAETYKFNGTVDPLQFLNSLPKKKASIDKTKTTNIAKGIDDQADYEGDGTQVVFVPITKTITQPVPVSIDGGSVVVNSSTSSSLTITQALVA